MKKSINKNRSRKLTPWNIFVKKVYGEGIAKNKNYKFKDALKDASKRKGEMKHLKMSKTKKNKKH
jgi:hypothetical protein